MSLIALTFLRFRVFLFLRLFGVLLFCRAQADLLFAFYSKFLFALKLVDLFLYRLDLCLFDVYLLDETSPCESHLLDCLFSFANGLHLLDYLLFWYATELESLYLSTWTG